MITGDPALDAWLTTHAWDFVLLWIFGWVALMLLPGLVALLGQDEDVSSNREWLASLADDEVAS